MSIYYNENEGEKLKKQLFYKKNEKSCKKIWTKWIFILYLYRILKSI